MGRERKTHWVRLGDSEYEARIPEPRWWAKPARRLFILLRPMLPASWRSKFALFLLWQGYGRGRTRES